MGAPVGVTREQGGALGAGSFQPPEILKTRRRLWPGVRPSRRGRGELLRKRVMARGERGQSRECIRFAPLGEVERGDPFRLDRFSIGEIVGVPRARLLLFDIGEPGLKRTRRHRRAVRREIAGLDLAPHTVAVPARGGDGVRRRHLGAGHQPRDVGAGPVPLLRFGRDGLAQAGEIGLARAAPLDLGLNDAGIGAGESADFVDRAEAFARERGFDLRRDPQELPAFCLGRRR